MVPPPLLREAFRKTGKNVLFQRTILTINDFSPPDCFSGADRHSLYIPVKDGELYEYAFTTFGTGEAQAPIVVLHNEHGKYFNVDVPRMSGMVLRKAKSENEISVR